MEGCWRRCARELVLVLTAGAVALTACSTEPSSTVPYTPSGQSANTTPATLSSPQPVTATAAAPTGTPHPATSGASPAPASARAPATTSPQVVASQSGSATVDPVAFRGQTAASRALTLTAVARTDPGLAAPLSGTPPTPSNTSSTLTPVSLGPAPTPIQDAITLPSPLW